MAFQTLYLKVTIDLGEEDPFSRDELQDHNLMEGVFEAVLYRAEIVCLDLSFCEICPGRIDCLTSN